MFRKLLLASIGSLGLLVPLTTASNADAHEYRHTSHEWHHRHEHSFRVYYRDSCSRAWSLGGKFCNRYEADRCAEGYRCRGLEICIR